MAERTIYLGNDFFEIAGPIWERDGDSGERALHHDVDCVAFITATAGTDTPIGGLSVACPEIDETAKYIIEFDADDVDTDLGALADGTTVYRVFTSPGVFRVEDALRVRKVRPST